MFKNKVYIFKHILIYWLYEYPICLSHIEVFLRY